MCPVLLLFLCIITSCAVGLLIYCVHLRRQLHDLEHTDIHIEKEEKK